MKEKTTRSKSDFYGACRLRTAVEFKFGCVYEWVYMPQIKDQAKGIWRRETGGRRKARERQLS